MGILDGVITAIPDSALAAAVPPPSVAVDAAAGFTVLNTYHVCPEDPSGTWVAYTRLLQVPSDGNARVDAEVWVRRRPDGRPQRVMSGLRARAHEGANVLWVGNGLLIAGTEGSSTIVAAEDGRVVRVLPWVVTDWSAATDRLIGHDAAGHEVRVHDLAADRTTTLFRREDLAGFAARMNGSDAPADWRLSDTRWAPGGAMFSFHLMTRGWETANRHLLTADATGGDRRLFGLKPMHDGWYDANLIFGHDDQVDDGLANDRTLRCWDRDRKVVIGRLAPPGCHVAVSPDGRHAVSESWYGVSPIVVSLHRTQGGATIELFRHGWSRMVWTLRAHVNMAFSADGRRLYVNRAISDGLSQVHVFDLSALIGR